MAKGRSKQRRTVSTAKRQSRLLVNKTYQNDRMKSDYNSSVARNLNLLSIFSGEVSHVPFFTPEMSRYLYEPTTYVRMPNASVGVSSVRSMDVPESRPLSVPGSRVATDRSVCEVRQSRREVLHAKGIAGGRVGPKTYTEVSKIICRRK